MDIVKGAAILYAIVTAGVVAFQFALAAGAPWGAYAMGGAAPGRFPPAMRVAALVQAALLAGMAVVILARAGLILPGWAGVSQWLAWVAVAITVISLVLNLISPSPGERRIWAPTLVLLILSGLVVAVAG